MTRKKPDGDELESFHLRVRSSTLRRLESKASKGDTNVTALIREMIRKGLGDA